MATVSSLASASSSGRVLVMVSGGLTSAPRLMLAPAGTRLPAGVRAVVVAPATRVPVATISGRRRAMRVEAGAGGDETEPGDAAVDEETMFERYLREKAVEALTLLHEIAPPDHLIGEAAELKNMLFKVVVEAGDEPLRSVLGLIRVAYAIVDLTRKCFPDNVAAPPPPFVVPSHAIPSPLPEGKLSLQLKDGSTLLLDFGPDMDDTAAMMRSVNMAMALAAGATAHLTTYRSE